jgi:type I restriction enzyme S subunit
VLRCHPGWSAEYLAHVLNATDFRRYITGATRDKLTQDDMNSISVPVVAYDEQLAVAKQLAQVAHWHQRTAHFGAKLAQALASYRSSLVHEAVTGRLDVSRVVETEMEERLHAATEGRLDEVVA